MGRRSGRTVARSSCWGAAGSCGDALHPHVRRASDRREQHPHCRPHLPRQQQARGMLCDAVDVQASVTGTTLASVTAVASKQATRRCSGKRFMASPASDSFP